MGTIPTQGGLPPKHPNDRTSMPPGLQELQTLRIIPFDLPTSAEGAASQERDDWDDRAQFLMRLPCTAPLDSLKGRWEVGEALLHDLLCSIPALPDALALLSLGRRMLDDGQACGRVHYWRAVAYQLTQRPGLAIEAMVAADAAEPGIYLDDLATFLRLAGRHEEAAVADKRYQAEIASLRKPDSPSVRKA